MLYKPNLTYYYQVSYVHISMCRSNDKRYFLSISLPFHAFGGCSLLNSY